jgi:hypothetical protein
MHRHGGDVLFQWHHGRGQPTSRTCSAASAASSRAKAPPPTRLIVANTPASSLPPVGAPWAGCGGRSPAEKLVTGWPVERLLTGREGRALVSFPARWPRPPALVPEAQLPLPPQGNPWLTFQPPLASSAPATTGDLVVAQVNTHPRLLDLRWLRFHAADLPNFKPHPCGYYGDGKRECRCSPRQIESYRQRMSGPLLDRIDLHVEVPLVDFRELSSASSGEKSSAVRERVLQARRVQRQRFSGSPSPTNSAMGARQVKEHCKLDGEGMAYLEQAMEQLSFSARAHDRILKVARTLADLAASPVIRSNDVLEAIQYRSLDRNLFQ